MTLDEILLLVCYEASAFAESTRLAFIGFAQAQVKFAASSPDIQNLAIANLAAHMMTMSKRGGASGQVASETEGSLSRSYFGMSTDTAGYGQTSYGREYLRLRAMFVVGGLTRAC